MVTKELFEATKMSAENGLSEYLKLFYDKIFPFELLEKWLSYGQGDFGRREFSFSWDAGSLSRYQFCCDASRLKENVLKKVPLKIDIGAVYSPKDFCKTVNDQNEIKRKTPIEKEFVIDIDMDQYNNIRTCCTDNQICKKCWKLLTEGANLIDITLREAFGFKHIIWLFSGRRGVHAWVCDKQAREVDIVTRASIAEYLRVVTGNDESGIKFEHHSMPLHPHLRMSYNLLKKMFIEVIVKDQKLFDSEAQVKKLLEFIQQRLGLNTNSLKTIRDILNSSHSTRFYEKLESEIKQKIKEKQLKEAKDVWKKNRNEYPLMEEIVLYYMYPRLDINVSKGLNHLLKSPFCVHPQSKKISVPIISFQHFDPNNVPSIYDLIVKNEDEALWVNKDPIMPYIHYFREFVEQTEK